ncbi:MAG: hypothetical protein WBN75_09235 [Verrucomicrobiia bacterium]
MMANRTGDRVLNYLKKFLSQRQLSVFLALGAILIMWPALKTGLMADDLVQRAVELRPDQLPAHLYDTGMPPDSGSLGTVLRNLFPGLGGNSRSIALAKNYGLLPWWTPDDLKLGLWRPLTAFTHWLDYRLIPDSPVLMHAENIACFGAIVFLITVVYRKLMGPGWAAGLAALLFLLDGYLYFPVMFVANRGFVLSLFFGLLCFYEHLQWRSTKSRGALVLSALALALSLFANEGGASTFAFILAYALVLEPGRSRHRALTVLPAVLVIGLWRIIYKLGGFGIFHVGLYIDPATEPLAFVRAVVPRVTTVLGGQLANVAPDFLFAIKPSLHPLVIVLYGVVVVTVLAVFLPWVRRDKIAAFWLAVMLLAAIPAATVEPLSKNFGFVAIGAYGLIAGFIAALIARPSPLPERLAYRAPTWIACVLLLLMHGPVPIVGRVLTAEAIASGSNGMRYLITVDKSPDVENKNVIVVNAPCAIALAYSPFYRVYHHQPLPRTLRTLVPGCTSFDVERINDQTLVIQSRAPDIFTCDDVGPAHFAYVFSACNVAIGAPKSKKGDRHNLDNLTVEVLEANAADVATRVAFRFDTSLDAPDFHWLWWDWRTLSYKPFAMPAIGQSVILSGPSCMTDSEEKN